MMTLSVKQAQLDHSQSGPVPMLRITLPYTQTGSDR